MSVDDTHTRETKGDGLVAVQKDLPGSVMIKIKRASMAAATAFLSINLFTGAPLLALWAGSQASGDTVLSMKAVAVVIVVLAVLVVADAFALTWLNNTYDALIGRAAGERRVPWLRDASSRGFMGSRVGETLLERIVIASVYVATIALLIWFFFFAHASLSPGG
jgi:hypothetical protein